VCVRSARALLGTLLGSIVHAALSRHYTYTLHDVGAYMARVWVVSWLRRVPHATAL